MDLKKLSQADQITGGAGILFIIFSFFPWFKPDVGDLGGLGDLLGDLPSVSGWDFTVTGLLPWLLVAAIVVLTALPLFGVNVKLPEKVGNFSWAQVVMIAAIVAAVLVVLRLLIGVDGGKRQIGLFLSVLAVIGVAVGTFLKSKEPQRGSAPPSAF